MYLIRIMLIVGKYLQEKMSSIQQYLNEIQKKHDEFLSHMNAAKLHFDAAQACETVIVDEFMSYVRRTGNSSNGGGNPTLSLRLVPQRADVLKRNRDDDTDSVVGRGGRIEGNSCVPPSVFS